MDSGEPHPVATLAGLEAQVDAEVGFARSEKDTHTILTDRTIGSTTPAH